jgi:hypothetical protein
VIGSLTKYLWPLSITERDFFKRPDQVVVYEDSRFAHARADLEVELRHALTDLTGLPANTATLDKARKAVDKAVRAFNSRHNKVRLVSCAVAYKGTLIDLDPIIHYSGVPYDLIARFNSYFVTRKPL